MDRWARMSPVAVSVATGALVLAACGGSTDSGAAATDDTAALPDVDCAAFEQYGDLSGSTVSFYTSVVAPDDAPYIAAFEPFEQCTGATVAYESSKEFEAQLVVRVQSGTAPDIALFPQPGLLRTVVEDTAELVPAPDSVVANVDEYYSEDWKPYGTVDGVFYAAPNGASVKSLVWYSPTQFAADGYEVPTTWEEMIALSDQIVADNRDGAAKPWCVGISSGDATGWPATDWMEDVMLRLKGPEVYDQWVNHEIPFNGPEVAEVLEETGGILNNPDYVNGGFGDVQSIASTTFQDAGLPILDGNCYMYKQSSFYSSSWPDGTIVAEDGDVWAFPLPPMAEATGNPILTGGEFVGAFSDRPEVAAFQTYLTSPEFVNARASQGNWTAPNTGLVPENVADPIARLGLELLQDPEVTLRFDGSDLMPAAVGTASFWTEMTEWIATDKPNQEVLDAIEASWPTS